MSSVASFPSISQDEFSAACTSLAERSHDRLDGTDWLSVHYDGSALNITKRIEGMEWSHEQHQNVHEGGEDEREDGEDVKNEKGCSMTQRRTCWLTVTRRIQHRCSDAFLDPELTQSSPL